MRTDTFKIFFLAAILALAVSCKDETKESQQTAAPTETKNQEEAKIAVNPAHGQPGHRCDLPVGAPLNTENTTNQPTSSTSNTSSSVSPIRVDQKPKVNPPHGEPYHDCSLPVGAKLE